MSRSRWLSDSGRGRSPLRVGHDADHLGEFRLCLPAEDTAALLWIAAAVGNVGWPEERGIDVDVLFPIEAELREGHRHELLERMALAGGDHEIVRPLLLQHAPHRLDVLRRVAPVA